MERQSKKPRSPRKGKPYSIRARMIFLGVLVLGVGFGALVAKLYQLQIVRGNELKTAANAQQVKDTVLEPLRGSILDSQGRVLARSSVVWDVEASPYVIGSRDENVEQDELASKLAAELAPILGVDEQELFEKLSDYDSTYKVLARRVDKPVYDQVEKIRQDYGLGQGISFTSSTRREYPYGNFMSSVLGFVNSSGHGTITGVEVSYDEQLAGVEGRRISARTRLDGEMATDSAVVYPAEDGYDVVLTIDADIQAIVEKNLVAAVEEHNPKDRVTAIVMDVNTGAILAMASKPDFDPNQADVILDTDQYNAIMAIENEEEREKALGDARSILWRNKAISELYDPGSVFKTITASAALDAGVITSNTTVLCNRTYDVLGQHYTCFQGASHGVETVADILKNSCNVGTIQLALKLGVKQFSSYFNAYGLTGPTGIDLPNEAQSLYHEEENMTLVNLASSSFGQSIGITPIQMITAASAVVNGGKLVTPHVVDRVQDQNGNVVEEIGTNVKRQVISEEVSEQMRGYLERVVTGDASDNYYSSARYASVYGYRIGGKSGTSDNLDNTEGFVSNFLGVAPINDPEIAVLVVVDDPQSWTDLTTYISIPVAGNILQEIMPLLGIQPEYTEAQLAETEIKVPNVSSGNLSHLSVARAELNRTGFTYRIIGNGNMVLHQFPQSGEIPRGSCVYLYTETTEDSLVTVPDFTGLSAEQAKQVAQSSYLNLRLEGDSGTITSQDVAAGTQVPMGKVITATLTAAEQPAEQPAE